LLGTACPRKPAKAGRQANPMFEDKKGHALVSLKAGGLVQAGVSLHLTSSSPKGIVFPLLNTLPSFSTPARLPYTSFSNVATACNTTRLVDRCPCRGS